MNLKIATVEDLRALGNKRGGRSVYNLAVDIERVEDELPERDSDAPYGNCSGCGVSLLADETIECDRCMRMSADG